jgi:putative DNA-invertase from lambdoid prophage Rac
MPKIVRIIPIGRAVQNVALYYRTSTHDQNTLNQNIRLRAYAEDRGWTYTEFEETESTRKTRPVKQQMFQMLRQGQFDAVVVYRLDRYARSSTELILEVKELVDLGVSFISVTENLDFNTAAGKLHFQILCAFAEFERELIRERTLEGLARAKTQGKTPGRPKGSKDKQKRNTSGYILRGINTRNRSDQAEGIYKDIKHYT